MTSTMLWSRIYAVVFALSIYVMLALSFKSAGNAEAYQLFVNFVPIAIGICAVFLADALQRRAQFVAALRDLWYQMVRAKGQMIAFLKFDQPTVSGFAAAWQSQSNVIDMLRGAYRNIGETDRLLGFRAYEPVMSMLQKFEQANPQAGAAVDRDDVAAAIEESWNALREVFLDEFDLPEPTRPIVVSNARRLKLGDRAASHAEALRRRQERRYRRAKAVGD